jgi:hypothetical protein
MIICVKGVAESKRVPVLKIKLHFYLKIGMALKMVMLHEKWGQPFLKDWYRTPYSFLEKTAPARSFKGGVFKNKNKSLSTKK